MPKREPRIEMRRMIGAANPGQTRIADDLGGFACALSVSRSDDAAAPTSRPERRAGADTHENRMFYAPFETRDAGAGAFIGDVSLAFSRDYLLRITWLCSNDA